MNCQEAQDLIEETIDNRLSESCSRKVLQHLARCASCKALFAAEKREHAALFRALNDVSDIPPPATSPAACAARLVASLPSLTRRTGHVAVPLWLKRAAVLAVLCGGAALAAWIGGTIDWEDRAPSDATRTVTPKPEGEPQVKRKLLAASSAIAILAIPQTQGASSAEREFDSFSSEFRTSDADTAAAFLSRSRMAVETAALPSFSSFEPKGLCIIIK